MFMNDDSAVTMNATANKVIANRVFEDEDCRAILNKISEAANRGEYSIKIMVAKISYDLFRFLKIRSFDLYYYEEEMPTYVTYWDSVQKMVYYKELYIDWSNLYKTWYT